MLSIQTVRPAIIAVGKSNQAQDLLFGNLFRVDGSAQIVSHRKAQVIARYAVRINDKMYTVAVLGPKKIPDEPHTIPARDDSRTPYQRFMQASHA